MKITFEISTFYYPDDNIVKVKLTKFTHRKGFVTSDEVFIAKSLLQNENLVKNLAMRYLLNLKEFYLADNEELKDVAILSILTTINNQLLEESLLPDVCFIDRQEFPPKRITESELSSIVKRIFSISNANRNAKVNIKLTAKELESAINIFKSENTASDNKNIWYVHAFATRNCGYEKTVKTKTYYAGLLYGMYIHFKYIGKLSDINTNLIIENYEEDDGRCDYVDFIYQNINRFNYSRFSPEEKHFLMMYSFIDRFDNGYNLFILKEANKLYERFLRDHMIKDGFSKEDWEDDMYGMIAHYTSDTIDVIGYSLTKELINGKYRHLTLPEAANKIGWKENNSFGLSGIRFVTNK